MIKLIGLVAAIFVYEVRAQSVDLMWKANALVSLEKVDSLIKCVEKKRCKDSRAWRLESAIHMAYANFANPEAPFLRKRTNDITVYHVMLNMGDKIGVLDVGFIYDRKTEEPLGPRVDRLPKGWMVMPKVVSGHLYLAFKDYEDPKSPSIIFSGSSPFDWAVVPP